MAEQQKRLTKCYQANMSNGPAIRIDQDEIEAALKIAPTGQLIRVRDGVINPNFMISISSDKERKISFHEDSRYDPELKNRGMTPLQDIFSQHRYSLPEPPRPTDAGGGGGRTITNHKPDENEQHQA